MGIRCLCPNGHRLNIKTFLAGKRGICPDCRARFTIPEQSDPSLSQDSLSGSDSKGHVSPPVAEPISAPEQNPVVEQSPVAKQSPVANAVPKTGSVAEFIGPTAEELRLAKESRGAKDVPVVKDVAEVANDASNAIAATGDPVSANIPSANRPLAEPVAEDFGTVVSGAIVSDAAVSSDAPVSAAQDPTAPKTVGVVSSTLNGGVDANADSSSTEWFVQIADGQRFGPADTEMMQGWISDGRVAPDNLIHQRGWPAWKTAAEVFPDLAGSQPSSAVTDSNALVFDGGLRTDKYRGRAAAKSRLFAVVAALGVTSVVLLAALIYVVRS